MNARNIQLLAVAGLFAALSASPAVLAAEAKPEHVRGTITAADPGSVTVTTREGATVRMALAEKLRVSGLARMDLAKIGKGAYIGTAAVPNADGTLHAQEVLIFPAPMKGVGEGHRPWDLTPDSTMTNASVDLVVDSVKGRVITLTYKGGSQKLTVPPETPVVTIVPAGRDKLVPGAHIFAVATRGAGGGYVASRISVGIDGVRPPM